MTEEEPKPIVFYKNMFFQGIAVQGEDISVNLGEYGIKSIDFIIDELRDAKTDYEKIVTTFNPERNKHIIGPVTARYREISKMAELVKTFIKSKNIMDNEAKPDKKFNPVLKNKIEYSLTKLEEILNIPVKSYFPTNGMNKYFL